VTILYVDTSALLKRVIAEPESGSLRSLLVAADASGDLLTASSLAWVEVWRALRRAGESDVDAAARNAVAGIAEFPLDEVILVRARQVGPDDLRSLDAIHLASAIAVGADSLVTYDARLAAAARSVGISVLAPTGQ
jgi:predicted nucleic acid-binding protein